MSGVRRWFFWILCAVLLAAAILFGISTMLKMDNLVKKQSELLKLQRKVKEYSLKLLPNTDTIAEAEALLKKYNDDIQGFLRYQAEHETKATNFELFFDEGGMTDNCAAIDLNKYRSVYETERDKVLENAAAKGKFSLPKKEECGFQYFVNADLSKEALPVLQKRFWISKAVYDALLTYNSAPIQVPGWEFSDKAGELDVKQVASISAIKAIRHKGILAPADITPDDPLYDKTRETMRAFYFFRYWRTEVELELPAEAVSGVLGALLASTIPISINSVRVRRIKDLKTDRYKLPASAVTITLLVSDFDDSLVKEVLRSQSPEAGD